MTAIQLLQAQGLLQKNQIRANPQECNCSAWIRRHRLFMLMMLKRAIAFIGRCYDIRSMFLLQAHTCNNTLELPNYQESLLAMHSITDAITEMTSELEQTLRNIIHDRLKLAVTCCNGYGLDQSHA